MPGQGTVVLASWVKKGLFGSSPIIRLTPADIPEKLAYGNYMAQSRIFHANR